MNCPFTGKSCKCLQDRGQCRVVDDWEPVEDEVDYLRCEVGHMQKTAHILDDNHAAS